LASTLHFAPAMRGIGNRFVDVLRSDTAPARRDVGITSDPDSRLEWHNDGPCGHATGLPGVDLHGHAVAASVCLSRLS
jgi:hypothetical protein